MSADNVSRTDSAHSSAGCGGMRGAVGDSGGSDTRPRYAKGSPAETPTTATSLKEFGPHATAVVAASTPPDRSLPPAEPERDTACHVLARLDLLEADRIAEQKRADELTAAHPDISGLIAERNELQLCPAGRRGEDLGHALWRPGQRSHRGGNS